MKDPQPIEIDQAQVEQLIEKAQQGTLNVAEQKRLVPLLKTPLRSSALAVSGDRLIKRVKFMTARM